MNTYEYSTWYLFVITKLDFDTGKIIDQRFFKTRDVDYLKNNLNILKDIIEEGPSICRVAEMFNGAQVRQWQVDLNNLWFSCVNP